MSSPPRQKILNIKLKNIKLAHPGRREELKACAEGLAQAPAVPPSPLLMESAVQWSSVPWALPVSLGSSLLWGRGWSQPEGL